MNFEELSKLTPWVTGETKHVLSMQPYENITLKFPGRHQFDTIPHGGDFVILVTDSNTEWVEHDFTHNDLFLDIDLKAVEDPPYVKKFMSQYAKVVYGGEDPLQFVWESVPPGWSGEGLGTLKPETFLCAVQCLALAEHRRYPQHEAKGGGRFLPARFAAGIAYQLWNSDDTKAVQRRGRPGVEQLERLHGKPPTLKELSDA